MGPVWGRLESVLSRTNAIAAQPKSRNQSGEKLAMSQRTDGAISAEPGEIMHAMFPDGVVNDTGSGAAVAVFVAPGAIAAVAASIAAIRAAEKAHHGSHAGLAAFQCRFIAGGHGGYPTNSRFPYVTVAVAH
jgi:hypothetical protein